MSHGKVIYLLRNGKNQGILLRIAELSSNVQIKGHQLLFRIEKTKYYKLKNILMTNRYIKRS